MRECSIRGLLVGARRHRLPLLLLTITMVLAPAAGAPAAPADQGKALFGQSCTGCHTIGGGDTVGPDLKDVAARRDATWIARFIAAPDKVIAGGDPIATDLLRKHGNVPMPNLGLTDAEVGALVAFLEAQLSTGQQPPPATTPTTTQPEVTGPGAPAVAPPGDSARGKSLFTGSHRLANDGPPCLSCHTIAGIGTLGGGALGPDLTGAYTKYGGTRGVPPVLEALPFPTMAPIFRDHPLTAAERADLTAFLEKASGSKRPSEAVWKLVLLALACAVVALGIALVIWPRRRLVVRRRLLAERSTTRRG